MNRTAVLLALSVAMLAFVLGACSNDSPIAPVVDDGALVGSSATKSDHIVGVHSATLQLWVVATNDAPVMVHRITDDWEELTVTFNSFGGAFDPTVINTFPVASLGYATVDVTDLVDAWVRGVHPNFGLLLDQDPDGTPWAKYYSREMSHSRPTLEVCYETLEDGIQCVSVEAIADTYIWELHPDANRGGDIYLYTGWTAPSELEKQSLIRFDLPEVPNGDGCSLTPGYWMTHSEYGPAPYDATWAELPDGADTPFFLSGKSYLQVLHTPPAGGHAYYILAFQYIAAELNRFAGADLAAVQAAFDGATAIFETYTPDQVKNFSKAQRAQLIEWADLLDDYNNGLIGPGHCDD
jgi:hypothetical protein